MYKKYFLVILFLLSLFNYSTSDVLVYDSNNFYCNNRIYCDNNYLSVKEINSICTRMTTDDRFVLLFTNKDNFQSENSYVSWSESFFSSQCLYNSVNCKYDFAICIYLHKGKIIITSGSIAKNVVTQSNRMNVINNMIIYLQSGDYFSAIENGIKQLSKLFYENGGGNYKNQGGNGNHSGGHSTFTFIFFLLILCCCCTGCYLLYKNQQKSNEELTYTQIIENSNSGNDNSYNQALIIHNHLNSLEQMINEIQQNDPPIKNTNLCLICMQPIINTPGTLEVGNTRFACQHVYHSNCLNRYNINNCLMCPDDDNSRVIIKNYYDSQVVNEENIKNLIKNLERIYPPQQLKIYSQTYPQEYNNFNEGLMVGMLASTWFMPPPVVVVNNGPGYGYGYDNYGQQPPPMYSNDPNPDSAAGGFQPTNVEMTQFNNNDGAGTTGGNFGGGATSNTGNFGGGFTSNYGDFGGDSGGFGNDGGDF